MTHTSRLLARASAAAAFALALFLACPDDAHAHGGNFQPPDPNFQPGDGGPDRPWRPPPPPVKPKPAPPMTPRGPTTPPPLRGPGGTGPGTGRPSTPTTPAPTPTPKDPGGDNKAPTTGNGPGGGPPTEAEPPTSGRGRPARRTRGRTSAVAPADTWEMWWALNRWAYLPGRALPPPPPEGVVTPREDGEGPLDRDALARARRALVVRQHIAPFLLKQLDPDDRSVRPEVRAAAVIALAKMTHDAAAVALICRHMEDPRAPNVVRESSAYALGMLRRTHEGARMDGAALDGVRARLLAVIDDDGAPTRTQAFAAFALGLLGDQPYGSAFTKDGRVVSRALWERALRKYNARDVPVALLTALGRMPVAGTSPEITKGLQRIVIGRRVGKRSWDTFERSHALDALVRQRGEGWVVTLLRTLTDKRLPAQVKRAAFIALGAAAHDLADDDRLAAAEAAEKGIRQARDGLTRGLGHIALGRILGADLATEKAWVVERSGARGLLLREARHGSNAHRGFSAIALALAVRGTSGPAPIAGTFGIEARDVLVRGFEREKDPTMRSAYVVALGLLGPAVKDQAPALIGLVADRGTDALLRGHAALTLAQLGSESNDARRALREAAWDKRSIALRRDAALALSFLGGTAETSRLLHELRTARSRWVLTQVAVALGQLGDLDAVPAIVAFAADAGREDEARALAIASLGLLGDPEHRPSTLRLAADANYPARTDALHEAFTLL